MRFPVVLFDLDGTIVDSGWMILASYRHATDTVLGREIPDDVLMAKVGSGHLEEQMREFDEEKAAELAQAYRDFYRPLHSELEAFPAALVEGVVGADCIRMFATEPGQAEVVADLLVGGRDEDQVACRLEPLARE